MTLYQAQKRPRRRSALRLALVAGIVVGIMVPAVAFAVNHRGVRARSATPGTATPATPGAATPASPDQPGTAPRSGSPAPAPVASPPPPPARPTPATAEKIDSLFRTGQVEVDSPGFWSWALYDRRSRKVVGGENTSATTTTASMIKAWIAADYLRRSAERRTPPTPERLAELSVMIRDSDNEIATSVFEELGGADSIRRLVSRCDLQDTEPYRDWWSNTVISARDAATMGACLADGRAAGKTWTGWLVSEMRQVRGFGVFGIRTQLPDDVAAVTAIKNGWIERDEDDQWYVNCMAVIGDRWSLAVLTRYDGKLGVAHGVGICQSVTRQLTAAA